MTPTRTFDPFRAQTRLLWRNRVARWRANAAETAFHGTALAALGLFLASQVPAFLERVDAAGQLRHLVQQWPMATAAVLSVVLLLRQHRIASDEAALRRSSWLSVLPLRLDMLRRRAWRRHAVEASLQGGVLLAALALADLGANAMVCAVAIAGVAAALAPWLPQRETRGGGLDLRQRSAVIDRGIGRLWRWQKVEAGIAFRARTMAGGILLLLLVPMGSGPVVVGVMLFCGFAMAWLIGAWRRALGVLVSAQAWLAPQPLRPAVLLRDTVAVPAAVLGIAMLAVCVLFVSLGTPRLAWIAALVLFAFGALHAACVAASRRVPRRIAIVFVLHVALLLAALQAYPPLVVVMWPLQVGLLLRKAVRA